MHSIRKPSDGARAQRAACALSAFVVVATAHATQTPIPSATLATGQQKLATTSVPFVPNAGQWDARAAFAAQTFAGTLFVTKEGELVYSFPGKPKHEATPSRRLQRDVGADSAALSWSQPSDAKSSPTNVHPEATPSRRLQGNVGADLAALSPSQPSDAKSSPTNVRSEATPSRRLQRDVGADSAALPVKQPSDAKSSPTNVRSEATPSRRPHNASERSPGWALTETLVDANGHARTMAHGTLKAPAGFGPMESKVSFSFDSDTTKHAENLSTYERVNLGDLYPGVNLQLRATLTNAGSNVEKIFTVAPNHDPAQIRVKLAGAQKLEINAKGELVAHTHNGAVAFTAPIAFQENDQGERIPVEVAYQVVGAGLAALGDRATPSRRLQRNVGADLAALVGSQPSDAKSSPTGPSDAKSSPTTYTFALGPYDPTRALVIDPLLASTYLGGSDDEQISAIAVHPHSGEVYVAGWTLSASFPAATGGAQPSATGTSCFVSRYSADLSRLMQSSYFGNGYVRCTSLAFNPSGDAVYVAGSAHSTSTLPSTSGAIQATHANASGSGFDGFVARLSIDLRALTKATYFGGAGFDDRIDAIAVHPMTGFVHVVGTTNSSTLPGTAVGTQPTRAGDRDAFIARLPADLLDAGPAAVRYTFIGGTNTDSGSALAIDSRSGDVFVAGQTSGGLPIAMLAGAAQPVYVGTGDAFIARLKQDLSSVVRATYFGGGGNDLASSLAMHPLTGEVVVAGSSESAAPGALPNVAGGAQSANGGGKDGFVSRLSADLTAIGQTTYFGGAGIECPANCTVAIHPQSGEVLVAGSTTAVLPAALVANGYQAAYVGGAEEAFVLRFNAALTQIRGGTHLGGSAADPAVALAIDPTGGSVYVAGVTDSANFPTVNPQQGTNAGGGDAFVSRFATDLAAVNRIPNPFSFIPQSNVPPDTIRTSNEVRLVITPTPPNNQQAAYVTGAVGSELCIATQPGVCVTPYVGCSSPCYSTGWFEGPWDFLSGDYIAVRHTSANPGGTTETKLIISGQAYPFRSSTGNANIACNLDMNGDNVLSHTVEGLILVRAMLGFCADAIVAGTGVSAWNPVRERLNQFCGTNFPFSPSAFQ